MSTNNKGKLRELLLPSFHDLASEMVEPEPVAFAIIEKKLDDLLKEPRIELENIIFEIEKNATEDTLFERMVLARLKAYYSEWFGD
jgi:hypothetical protein